VRTNAARQVIGGLSASLTDFIVTTSTTNIVRYALERNVEQLNQTAQKASCGVTITFKSA